MTPRKVKITYQIVHRTKHKWRVIYNAMTETEFKIIISIIYILWFYTFHTKHYLSILLSIHYLQGFIVRV